MNQRLFPALILLSASCSPAGETAPLPADSHAGGSPASPANAAGSSAAQSGNSAGGAAASSGGAGGSAGAGVSAGAGGNAGAGGGSGGSASAGASAGGGNAGGGVTGPSVGGGIGACPANLALKMPTIPPTDALVDGDYTTSVNFHGGGSFYVDFGSSKEIGRVTIVPNVGHTWTNSYTYSVSEDATNWTQVDQLDAVVWLPIERSFAATKGRYFKVSINGAAWPEGAVQNEVEVYPPLSSTENLAKGKAVTSSYMKDAALATDGDIGTLLDLSGGDGFVAPSPAWTTVDLGEEMPVNRVRYYSSAHAPTPAYDVAVSKDDANFTTVVHVDGDNYDSFSNHCFEQQKVRYVRITVPTVRPSDNSGPGTQIREIQVFGPGSKP